MTSTRWSRLSEVQASDCLCDRGAGGRQHGVRATRAHVSGRPAHITLREKALLIFDEVMTGFRVAFGGAQERYGILPDLTTMGKIIGGGLPVGAYGGPVEIMDLVAPLGPVYQAGTLSGNPLAMAAGLATLRYLRSHKGRSLCRLGQAGRGSGDWESWRRPRRRECRCAVTA